MDECIPQKQIKQKGNSCLFMLPFKLPSLTSSLKIHLSIPQKWKAKLSLSFHPKALLQCYCAFHVNRSKLMSYLSHINHVWLYIFTIKHCRCFLPARPYKMSLWFYRKRSMSASTCVCVHLWRVCMCMHEFAFVRVLRLSRISVLYTVAQTAVDSLQKLLTFSFSQNNTWRN